MLCIIRIQYYVQLGDDGFLKKNKMGHTIGFSNISRKIRGPERKKE